MVTVFCLMRDAIWPQTLLVILVDFQDVQHTKSVEGIQTAINQLSAYYDEVSYGKMSVVAQVYGWYTVSHTMGYYGHDSKNLGDDDNIQQLATDAVNLLPPVTNPSQFKLLMIVHAGQDQADDQNNAKSDEIWSSCFCSVFPYYQAQTPIEAPGSKAFNNYMFVSEDNGYGTFAHEVGHSLGLPDLYKYGTTAGESKSYVGFWSLMDAGNYCCTNDAETTPSYIGGWGAVLLGWLTPTVADSNALVSSFSLKPLESPAASAILIPVSPTTYYFIEYRTKTGSDSQLPNSGILVYYADESRDTGQGILQLVNPVTGALYPLQSYATSLANVVFKITDRFSEPSDRVYLTFIGGLNTITTLYSTQAVTASILGTTINAPQTSLSGLYDENLTLFATLIDQSGVPMSGQTVEIDHVGPTGEWQGLGSTTTDALGRFSFQLPLAYSVGSQSFRFFYTGGKGTNTWYTSSETEFSININPGQMILMLSTPGIAFGQSSVDVSVHNPAGASLFGVTLTLYVDNVRQGITTSDRNGHAAFQLNFPFVAVGPQTVTVKADAEYYQSTQNSQTTFDLALWIVIVAIAASAGGIGIVYLHSKRKGKENL